jgi:hypothetical protein
VVVDTPSQKLENRVQKKTIGAQNELQIDHLLDLQELPKTYLI